LIRKYEVGLVRHIRALWIGSHISTAPVTQRTEVIFSDLPIYAGAIVTVEITGAGDVALGELALGVNYNLGASTNRHQPWH
jgi:hypothetical protein